MIKWDCSSSRQNLTGIVIVESPVGPPINIHASFFGAKKNMFRDGLSSKQRNRDWIERWSNDDCSSSRQNLTGIVIVESPVGPPINTHASFFARRRACFVMDFLASRGTVIGSKGDQMMIVLLHDETSNRDRHRRIPRLSADTYPCVTYLREEEHVSWWTF